MVSLEVYIRKMSVTLQEFAPSSPPLYKRTVRFAPMTTLKLQETLREPWWKVHSHSTTMKIH
jgi:hypothetical protein